MRPILEHFSRRNSNVASLPPKRIATPKVPTRRCVWEAFEEQRAKLMHLRDRFDRFHAVSAVAFKPCLVRFDSDKDSVKASAVGSNPRRLASHCPTKVTLVDVLDAIGASILLIIYQPLYRSRSSHNIRASLL